ncbi:MAG: P-loop NTPase [Brevinematia bacterium]
MMYPKKEGFMVTRDEVIEVLKHVTDPEVGRDIVEMGMVRTIEVKENEIECEIILTTPACPAKNKIESDVKNILNQKFGEKYKINVIVGSDVRKAPDNPIYRASGARIINLDNIEKIRNIIAVYSCKGGVGKTTVAVNLSIALAKYGARVGLLDLDLHGPNVPTMLGLIGQPKVKDLKIIPPEIYGVKVFSPGLLIDRSFPIMWRGPIQTVAVKQLFEDILWGEIDYLVLDLPPGTGDIHITLSQNIPISGMVMVSTPQLLAIIDTIKGVNMFEKMGVPTIGIILNMSYYLCPHCSRKIHIFPKVNIDDYSEGQKIDILGELPLDPKIAELSDRGIPIVIEDEENYISKLFADISSKVASNLSTISIKKS